MRQYILATLLLITALSLSAIAAYYAVAGLAAIFAASVIPIIFMGSALEAAKLVLASFLYRRWGEINVLIRTYFMVALVLLICLTSMGIYGFLSKSHVEQALDVGDNTLQVELIDNKIGREQNRIKDAETQLEQLDGAVRVLQEYDRIRGPDGAIAVRESQKEERQSLSNIIDEAADEIALLQEDKVALQKEQLTSELKLGPVKYIAALVYGSNVGGETLETAVRIVILVIVFVFDPLAILLLIAANMELMRIKRPEEKPKSTLEVLDEMKPTNVREDMRVYNSPENIEDDPERGKAWVDEATDIKLMPEILDDMSSHKMINPEIEKRVVLENGETVVVPKESNIHIGSDMPGESKVDAFRRKSNIIIKGGDNGSGN